MMGFSLWKELKKKLRRRGRPLWSLGSLLFLLVFAASCLPSKYAEASPHSARGDGQSGTAFISREASLTPEPSLIEALASRTGPLTVKLRRIYICGEETRLLGELSPRQTVSLLSDHPEWTARLDKDGIVWMDEEIDDWSVFCKSGTYFGVDKYGNLSLFDGLPKKEKVLRTFFQLDVQYLESSLSKEQVNELEQGILVTDLVGLNSVLSTFSDYAIQESERVMKPTY
jgi:forespore regulator of the sigma-K checkpoint